MIIWLFLSLISVGAIFTTAVLYALRFHLLLKATRHYPKLHQQLGHPRGLMDYSRDHNCECYDAINRYFLERRYLELTDDKLRQRFISQQSWNDKGKVWALIVVANMAVCVVAIAMV
ncbi:hypothetical protein [Vibrio sp. CAU 1672]|uniref:hypothetical protein n=1 Tax=Vibrio sp. CAU 1672 TaxID=3032594 RepID=UPI0023DAA839|nr:hypothetical protein [Vibrio sp. CAU 1672]MDF2152177.1 hypothetical protein [Vibrio sp. CAU 1672]